MNNLVYHLLTLHSSLHFSYLVSTNIKIKNEVVWPNLKNGFIIHHLDSSDPSNHSSNLVRGCLMHIISLFFKFGGMITFLVLVLTNYKNWESDGLTHFIPQIKQKNKKRENGLNHSSNQTRYCFSVDAAAEVVCLSGWLVGFSFRSSFSSQSSAFRVAFTSMFHFEIGSKPSSFPCTFSVGKEDRWS